jgi:SAM-dependent methyltransferase
LPEWAVYEALRTYWDADAATYDGWPEHRAWSSAERAAWAAVLKRLLPPRGARVLDVGAGTGFLSLAAARLGYDVTALDISSGMLDRLRLAAASEKLTIKIVQAAAHEPPAGPFDAVMERQLLWMQPDPKVPLAAWREVTSGPLLVFELFFKDSGYLERTRRQARRMLRNARRLPPEHHDPSAELRTRLPRPSYPTPGALIELVEATGWRAPQLLRLRDVEWARQITRSPLERLAGSTPEYVISAT